MINVLAAAVIAMSSHTYASTDDHIDMYAAEETVNLSDLPAIDSMPVCRMEDGSDVAIDQLPCVWHNDGNEWLTYEDRSLLVIDDTVS